MKRTDAEVTLLQEFECKVEKEFNFIVKGFAVFERRGGPYIEFGVDFTAAGNAGFQDYSRIRIYPSPRADKGIEIAYGGNNILDTGAVEDSYEARAMAQFLFIADMLKAANKWEKLLRSIDLTPLLEEQAAKLAAEKTQAAKTAAEQLAAYEAANIVVGTKIKFPYGTYTVSRISGTKIQFTERGQAQRLMDKTQVGSFLIKGDWEVV